MDDAPCDRIDCLPGSHDSGRQSANGIPGSPPSPVDPTSPISERSHTSIYALAWRLVGTQSDAEAVTHAVLSTMRQRGQEGRPAVELAEIPVRAVHTPQDDQAQNGKTCQYRSIAASAKPAELAPLFEQALLRLPDAYRDVFVLADIEGMSLGQTARLLSLTRSTAKVRLHRARLLMQDCLAPHWSRLEKGRQEEKVQ
jgi:hypothetical protein